MYTYQNEKIEKLKWGGLNYLLVVEVGVIQGVVLKLNQIGALYTDTFYVKIDNGYTNHIQEILVQLHECIVVLDLEVANKRDNKKQK